MKLIGKNADKINLADFDLKKISEDVVNYQKKMKKQSNTPANTAYNHIRQKIESTLPDLVKKTKKYLPKLGMYIGRKVYSSEEFLGKDIPELTKEEKIRIKDGTLIYKRHYEVRHERVRQASGRYKERPYKMYIIRKFHKVVGSFNHLEDVMAARAICFYILVNAYKNDYFNTNSNDFYAALSSYFVPWVQFKQGLMHEINNFSFNCLLRKSAEGAKKMRGDVDEAGNWLGDMRWNLIFSKECAKGVMDLAAQRFESDRCEDDIKEYILVMSSLKEYFINALVLSTGLAGFDSSFKRPNDMRVQAGETEVPSYLMRRLGYNCGYFFGLKNNTYRKENGTYGELARGVACSDFFTFIGHDKNRMRYSPDNPEVSLVEIEKFLNNL